MTHCLPLLYEEGVLVVVVELQIVSVLRVVNIAYVQPIGRDITSAQLVHVKRHAGLSRLHLISRQRVSIVAHGIAKPVEIDLVAC